MKVAAIPPPAAAASPTNEQIEEVKRQMKPCLVCGTITCSCYAFEKRFKKIKNKEEERVKEEEIKK